MKNKINFKIQWGRTLILLVACILSGILFFCIGQRSLETKTQGLKEASNNTTEYKKVSNFDIEFEVPSTWSVYYGGDIEAPENNFSSSALFSVGENSVTFGDLNWSQVDFSISNGDYKEDLAGAVRDGGVLSTENVGGMTIDVVTFPLDNGEATKGGTGGKIYYFNMPDSNHYFKTLKMFKQAQGEKSFEEGFEHLLKTFKISNERVF